MSSSVNFIVDNAHGWDVADYSIQGAQRLLDAIGISDNYDCLWHHCNERAYETLAISFQEEISQLGQTLVANVSPILSTSLFPFFFFFFLTIAKGCKRAFDPGMPTNP
jgi:hypothetical protein